MLDLKKQVATGTFDKEPLPFNERKGSVERQLEAFTYEERQKLGVNVTADAIALLRRHNIKIDKKSDTYPQLLNAIGRAKIRAIQAIQSRNEGDHVATPHR
ncbi:MAG: hypothetical protein L3J67_01275 [Hyphomicrobiaceae bacterium]|nr:hypothetical protein [Hyphomicrobiaceae bacterium]